MKTRHLLLITCWPLITGLATARAGQDCPSTADLNTAHFVGDWTISLAAAPGQKPERGLLQLQPHPIYSDSLKGSMARGAQQWQVVADWEDDTLTLEESLNGEQISATWQARAVMGQCGLVLEGIRFTGSEPDTSAQRFRMRSERHR